MKTSILILILSAASISFSQTIYEVTPGTKGNQIIISLSNISDIENAENVQVKITKYSQNLSFNKEEQLVERINARNENEVSFRFDIKREAPANKKDTLEFTITGNNGIFTTKQFILNYAIPKDYKLEQNFPNPFNPTTTIQYQLPIDSRVTLKVYDILGSEVAALVNEFQQAGYKEIKFDASTLSSGIYIYRFTAQNPANGTGYISTKKMLMVK